jgi:hypothetical protein
MIAERVVTRPVPHDGTEFHDLDTACAARAHGGFGHHSLPYCFVSGRSSIKPLRPLLGHRPHGPASWAIWSDRETTPSTRRAYGARSTQTPVGRLAATSGSLGLRSAGSSRRSRGERYRGSQREPEPVSQADRRRFGPSERDQLKDASPFCSVPGRAFDHLPRQFDPSEDAISPVRPRQQDREGLRRIEATGAPLIRHVVTGTGDAELRAETHRGSPHVERPTDRDVARHVRREAIARRGDPLSVRSIPRRRGLEVGTHDREERRPASVEHERPRPVRDHRLDRVGNAFE